MKPKTRTPWARYITIGLFILVFVTIIAQQFSRPQAAESSSNMKLEFNKTQEHVRTFDSDASWRHVTQDENEANQEFPCSEPSLGCVVNGMTKRQLDWWKNELSGSATQSGSTSKTSDAGVLGQVGNLISLNYTPQASGVYYLADALGSVGLATPTYAQGYGFYALSPFLRLWRVFRNVVYMIFAIMIIVIAILILFRQKVGSQAAVTAQQAIPRIVIALILVTFSYAIAGFMIDVMYWCMYAISRFITVEAGTLKGSNTKVTKAMLLGGSFADLAGIVLSGQFSSIYDGVNDLVKGFFSEGIWSKITGFVTGTVISLIFIIALLFSLFRLLFILMKAYASVLLYTIFSPFFLMLYAVPGTNSFNNWIKKLAANLAPSIIVFVMLIMTGVMNQYTSGSATDAGGFVPPYITANGGSGATLKSVGAIVCFAILLAMPEIVNGIQQKLGGGPGFFEQMAGAAGGRFMRYGGGMAWGYLSGGMMGMGRGVGRQIRGVAAGTIINTADSIRRHADRVKASNTSTNNRSGAEMAAILNEDRRVMDAQRQLNAAEADVNASAGKAVYENQRQNLSNIYQGMTVAELDDMLSTMQKNGRISDNDFLYAAGLNEQQKREYLIDKGIEDSISSETDTSKQRLLREHHALVAAAKGKRTAYDREVADYATRNNIQNTTTAAEIQKAFIEDLKRLDEGSWRHWRRASAQRGFWSTAGEAWGLTNFATRRDAIEQAWQRRKLVASQQAINRQLGRQVSENELYRSFDNGIYMGMVGGRST